MQGLHRAVFPLDYAEPHTLLCPIDDTRRHPPWNLYLILQDHTDKLVVGVRTPMYPMVNCDQSEPY